MTHLQLKDPPILPLSEAGHAPTSLGSSYNGVGGAFTVQPIIDARMMGNKYLHGGMDQNRDYKLRQIAYIRTRHSDSVSPAEVINGGDGRQGAYPETTSKHIFVSHKPHSKRATQLSLDTIQKASQRPGDVGVELPSQVTTLAGLRTQLKGETDEQDATSRVDTTALAPGSENFDGQSGRLAAGRARMDAIAQQAKRRAKEDADRMMATQGKMGVYSTLMSA